MSETNFEKNVQQEMLGFKIKPSEEVWTKVEERIRKKKRKRFFFLFLFAGLALLGYWQRDHLFNEKEPAIIESVSTARQETSSNENIKNKEQDNLNDKIIEKESHKNEIAGIKNDVPIFNKKQKSEEKQSAVLILKESTTGNISKIAKQGTKTAPEEINTDQQKANTEKPAQMQVATNASDLVKVMTEKKEIENKGGAEIKMDTTASKEIEKISDSIFQAESKLQIDSIQKSESKADTVAETKKQPALSKKWKWGMQITPGISSLVNQTISFSGNKSADFAGSPPAGFPVPPASASKRNSGFAFQLSGFVQKRILPKTEISLGLQYSYYSDRIRVGDFRLLNQSAGQPQSLFGVTQGYRAANPAYSFTDHYHFIELPVNFLFQLNKNPDKPFYLDIGFKAGRMISSNALVYDTAFGGIYFESKDQFNKTQFSLSPGFLWTLPSKKFQWSIGPLLNVHINRFLKNSFEGDKYLLMPGIRTKIILIHNN